MIDDKSGLKIDGKVRVTFDLTNPIGRVMFDYTKKTIQKAAPWSKVLEKITDEACSLILDTTIGFSRDLYMSLLDFYQSVDYDPYVQPINVNSVLHVPNGLIADICIYDKDPHVKGDKNLTAHEKTIIVSGIDDASYAVRELFEDGDIKELDLNEEKTIKILIKILSF